MNSTPKRIARSSPGRYGEGQIRGAAEVLGFEQLGSTIMPNHTTVIARGLTNRNPLDDEDDVQDFDLAPQHTGRQLLHLPTPQQ